MPLSVFRSWSWPDRAVALGLADYEAGLCSGCGGDLSETMDPENRGRYDVDTHRCYRCEALGIESRSWEQQDQSDAARGAGRQFVAGLRKRLGR